MAQRRIQFAAPTRDPLWYKDAIVYEVHVRAFLDSNGDGIGDFRGLTQKLGYLQDPKGLQRVPCRSASAESSGHYRTGGESHVGPAPLVSTVTRRQAGQSV